jgi:predicted Zn-ribbon and HTH transcriptional regulator
MSSISINLNRTKGYTKASNFDVSINYQYPNDILKIKWTFGDGAVLYDKREASHKYAVAGEYDIELFAYTEYDVLYAKKTVIVENYIKDSVYFNVIPPPAFAGHINRYPFRVVITTASTSENVINLHAQYSRSYPYQQPQNKWSFLRPEWRFLDLDGNPIWNIKTIDSPLKINADGKVDQVNGITVGVSGYAEFYFVDDIFNNDLAFNNQNYTTLWATLETSGRRVVSDSFNSDLSLPGFSNSSARAFAPYIVLKRFPEKLIITENGLRPHANPRWTSSIQPVVIKAGFNDNFSDDWIDGNGILSYEPFAKYVPFEQEPILQFDAGVVNLSTNFVPRPYFQWIDDTSYKVAGYYKGSFYVDPSTPYAFSTTITAAAVLETGSTVSNYHNPHIWLSNPESGTVSVAQYYKNNTTDFQEIKNLNLEKAQVKTFNMPIINDVDFFRDSMALSGFHGIYSIAALPSPNFHAWLCDSELGYLYRVTTTGNILCSIDLKNLVKQNNLDFNIDDMDISPTNISLDGEKNIWVTMHDTLSVLKLDPIGNFLFAVAPTHIKESVPTTVYDWFIQNSYYPETLNNYDHRLIEPTGIETDKDNNVWVTYSNYLSGFVMKYSSTGNLLYSINSPVCSCPQELISDKDGNVWICNNGNIWGAFGSIQKRSSNGVLLSTFNGIKSPNYLTLDTEQNLWFSYGYNKIGFINNINGNTSTYTISGSKLCSYSQLYKDYPKSNLPFSKYPSQVPWFNETQNVDETSIEGIGCDTKNLLYVINSIENSVYVFDTITRKTIDSFNINPQGFLFYSNGEVQPTKMKLYDWSKSLQASGDWTGYRWLNKYGKKYLPFYTDSSTNFKIYGESEKLNFYDRSVFTAFKINEDFNLAEQIKNTAKMEVFEKCDFLFDSFLGNIFGKKPFYQDDLAVTAFEKIANFVSNNSDPDTCEIPQLYNMSNMLNSKSEDLQLNYPPTIKRVMNLASIDLSKILGTNCNCGYVFERHNDCAKTEMCPYCKKEKKSNRGDVLSTTSYQVTAGTPVVMKNKGLNNYRLVPTGKINNQVNYTLNVLSSSLGLLKDWSNFYEYYEYIPNWNGGIIENIIDWNSDQTTINRNLSTNEEWYKNEGLLDIFFNYEIYKGLGLLDD